MSKLFEKKKRNPDYTVRCYLTLRCDSMCSFCSAQVQLADYQTKNAWQDAEIWAAGINRRRRNTVLAGGEPFMYCQFPQLISLLDEGYKIEIYTNLRHPVKPFLNAANRRFQFLISLHPNTQLNKWRDHVDQLDSAGHSLRFHIVRTPGYEKLTEFLKDSGIVGRFQTALQGDQRTGPKSGGYKVNKEHPLVECSSKIFLFGPDGYNYHCMHKMVTGAISARFGHITEEDYDIETKMLCNDFGFCAGCDNNIEGEVTDVVT